MYYSDRDSDLDTENEGEVAVMRERNYLEYKAKEKARQVQEAQKVLPYILEWE
jgi:hypothetical protein